MRRIKPVDSSNNFLSERKKRFYRSTEDENYSDVLESYLNPDSSESQGMALPIIIPPVNLFGIKLVDPPK